MITPTFSWVWDTNSIGRKPISDELKDYVVEVHWRYRGSYNESDDVNNTISIDKYGVQNFKVEYNPNYIPFEDLTEEIIIGWLNLDEEAMQLAITNEIENILNPPIIYSNLPN